MAMESKFSFTTSSHSSTGHSLSEKLADLEKFRDEPRQRWVSGVTFAMLSTIMLCSIGGFILSGLVFGDKFAVSGQCAGQSFVMFASILAVPYLALHIRAAQTNFSIIRSQPFQHPLHSWTIIVARLAFLAWAAAVIASSVSVAKTYGDKVHLQLDLFFCVSAFLAMTVCVVVVEKSEEPFILPWISPRRSVVCRISSFGDMVDDSISRRGSNGSAMRPAGPRPLDGLPSIPSDPIVLHLPEDDLLFPNGSADAGDEPANPEPALKMPRPTLPVLSERYKSDVPEPAAAWKHDWSIFAGEAGLRASGTSTLAGDRSTFDESSASGSSLTSPPYSVWTPMKHAQAAPAARSYKSGKLSASPSKRSLLPTVPEVITPTMDIFEFMGGYSSPDSSSRPTTGERRRSNSVTSLAKARVPKVTVEDVPDESFSAKQASQTKSDETKLGVEQSSEAGRATTPKIPGSFVDDHPAW